MNTYSTLKGGVTLLLLLGFIYAPFMLSSQSLDEKVEQLEASFRQQRLTLEDLKLEQIERDLKKNGLPKRAAKEEVIWHPGFWLSYSETHEQPLWVAHMILPEINEYCAPRSDRFLQDSTLQNLSASNEPYADQKPKKYDRGHMAPAADFRWSPKAMDASFYFSNISPQKSTFNQNFWAQLEVFVRDYVRYYESPLYVVTGPVLKGQMDQLENAEKTEKVSIPSAYFKVLMDLKRNRAIGFLVPQTATSRSKPSKYAMKIDDIEKETGIDFFASFRKKMEDDLESQLDYEIWDVGINPAEATPVTMTPSDNEKGIYNTLQAVAHKGEAIKVVGKVISVTQSDDGTIRLALDKNYSKGKCSISIEGVPWSLDATLPYRDFRGLTVVADGMVKNGAFGRVDVIISGVGDIQLWNR